MKLTFVHTSTMLNLRGSEMWLIDMCNLLRGGAFYVSIVNFDYDRRYPRTEGRNLRYEMVKTALAGTPLIQLAALRLRLPKLISQVAPSLNSFVEDYLHFLPLSRRFLDRLRHSDVVYFLQCQRSPAYLIATLVACAIAGRRHVIAGIHVTPEIKPFDIALMKLFVRIGVLKAIHLTNKEHKPMFQRLGCKLVDIPNGVQYDKFYESGNGKNSQTEFSILFVGAMTEVKGANMLPEIYSALKTQNIQFSLVICTSGGELAEEIKKWSSDKPDVFFKGFVERSELARLYRNSSVVLFPSRRESFPLAALEAQASGTPVVVSDIVGFRQSVVEGSTGFFTRTYTPQSFAETIAVTHKLWKEDRAKYVAICNNATEYVRDNFQWKNMFGKLTNLFETL